jgi:hypothetical protein
MLAWNSRHAELQMAHRDLIRLSGNAHTVVCISGSLWITQDEDTRDVVLEAGQRFTTPGSAATLLYALVPARVTIEHDGPQPAAARHPKPPIAPRIPALQRGMP